MKRNKAIDEIINKGSVKQKIRLYMTDIALLNVDPGNLELTDSGEIKGSTLLSAEEREYLYQSIKTTKDIEYYESLRKLNSVFLFFKERATAQINKLQGIYFLLCVTDAEINKAYEGIEVVNKLLTVAIPRRKAYTTAIRATKKWGGTIKNEKLDIDPEIFYQDIKHPVNIAIRTATNCKDYIVVFKKILSRDLPIQPYRDWVKATEQTLKKVMSNIYNITTGAEKYPKDYPKFPKYEDIVHTVTDEDVKDFKTSQL